LHETVLSIDKITAVQGIVVGTAATTCMSDSTLYSLPKHVIGGIAYLMSYIKYCSVSVLIAWMCMHTSIINVSWRFTETYKYLRIIFAFQLATHIWLTFSRFTWV